MLLLVLITSVVVAQADSLATATDSADTTVENTVHATTNDHHEAHHDAATADDSHAEAHGAEHGGGHESNTDALFFIILGLLIGTLVRHFLKRTPLPFTVLLLLIGLGLGILNRLGFLSLWDLGFTEWDVSFLSSSLDWAANIDPHMLLFVFLPILIFEAAFAMDVHVFKKTAVNAGILAIPGIIMAMFLTAMFAMGMKALGLGFGAWTWPIALMFGAVISATDPVAVVALLKELGASKKLGTLIEGESLLNDGTAIVLFMVFFLGITGAGGDSSPIVEFFRVALGGTAVGLIIGILVLQWFKRVVNDAMVEISVGVAAAYLAFYVAEHFFHVSGVLALVTLGIVLGGVGRSRISPQVEHFMHEFWELAGFIANSLIFLIVGVVIAERSVFSVNDFITLGIVYVGIHVVRALVIFVLYPLMRKTGYGLPTKDAIVLWFGALRGAIGLALALIVAGVDDQYIPAEIRDQFLFLIAGTVTLTLLVNATTIKFVVNGLGLTKVAPAKAQMVESAHEYLKQATEVQLKRMQKDRYLKHANFDAISAYLPEQEAVGSNGAQQEMETVAELRKRVLQKEKSSYWHQFKSGLLSPEAVRTLSDGIDEVLDANGQVALSERNDFDDTWETPKLLARFQKVPVVGPWCNNLFVNRVSLSYDCAVGFVQAQNEGLELLKSLSRSGTEEETKVLPMIEAEINENKIHAQTYIRNLRKSNPKVFEAASTRQAARSILNYERKTIERLQKNGRIDSGEAGKMIGDLEKRAKKLSDRPPMAK